MITQTGQRLVRLLDDDNKIILVLGATEARRLAHSIINETKVRIIPEDEIVSFYREHRGTYGLGLRYIAERYQCSHSTIQRILKKHGVL